MSKKKLIGIIGACIIVVIVILVIVSRPTPTYTLSLTVSPSGAGSVSPSGGEYKSGMQITLTATPATGYKFANWAGDVDTVADVSAASTTIMMKDNYSITANFAQEIWDWPYPRHDLSNTAAYTRDRWQLLDGPIELWEIIAEEGHVFGSFFPVAADIDNDGCSEYLIGRTNFSTGDGWLDAINIEDGSILWTKHLDVPFYWSAPVIVDLNNDDQLDIVFGSSSFAEDEHWVMALNGSDASLIWEQPLPASGMGTTVADVNNDGCVEVIINDYGNPKMIYLLNGQDGSLIWQRQTGGSAYNIPAVGDIDGDGYPEIVQHNHLYDPSRERLLVWNRDGEELWTHVASPSPEQEANAPPELGWVPDFGYVSATIADFNADGEVEIGWGSRCHYYLLNSQGKVLWQVPTVEGYGLLRIHKADGTIEPDIHGTGGLHIGAYASATGNLDEDPALEIVVSLGPEYCADYYESDGTVVYDNVTPANMVWALDGKDGTVQWVFEGEYPSENGIEAMYEPILVDLTGDGLLDVLVLSRDNHLYAIHGATGEQLLAYPALVPKFWYAVHLTFVRDGDKGIVLYSTLKGDSTYTTNALQIAQHVSTTP